MFRTERDAKQGECRTKDRIFQNGAVTTESRIASDAGMRIMQRGGNAVDAAVATAIHVGVVNPFSSGIGGGGVLMVMRPGDREAVDVFDFRETAPRGLTPEMLRQSLGSTQRTGLSVAVPGEIRGLYDVHKMYGRLPWRELFRDAIELCRGFPATDLLVKRLNLYREDVFGDPGLSSIYTRDGEIVGEGDTIVRENYANTLGLIAEDPEQFYTGRIASRIVEAVRANGGVMDMEDLRNYRMVKRDVQVGSYKDYAVYVPDLPTSGISVIQGLNILENFDLEEMQHKDMSNGTSVAYHLIVEVLKFVYARRGELGDPEFVDGVDGVREEILSKENAQRLASRINMNEILPIDMYGMKAGGVQDNGTTHINVVDDEGMVVLVTTSVNLDFGAKYMDTETGIILNNHVDDFYIPGVKNFHGLEAGGANQLEPMKRPFSSMCPTLLVKGGEVIAVGGVGGIKITSAVLFTLFSMFQGMSMRESILRPRLHHQFSPMTVFVEGEFPDEAARYLSDLGHKVERCPGNRPGSAVYGVVVRKDADGNKKIEAVSDPRKGGGVSGW